MKLVTHFILILSMFFSMSSHAKDVTSSEWKLIDNLTINSLIYDKKGDFISTQFGNFSGLYMIYHIKAEGKIYKCVDSLKGNPHKAGEAKKTSCYQLTKNDV